MQLTTGSTRRHSLGEHFTCLAYDVRWWHIGIHCLLESFETSIQVPTQTPPESCRYLNLLLFSQDANSLGAIKFY